MSSSSHSQIFGRVQISGQIWPPNPICVDLLIEWIFGYPGTPKSPPRTPYTIFGIKKTIFTPGFLSSSRILTNLSLELKPSHYGTNQDKNHAIFVPSLPHTFQSFPFLGWDSHNAYKQLFYYNFWCHSDNNPASPGTKATFSQDFIIPCL